MPVSTSRMSAVRSGMARCYPVRQARVGGRGSPARTLGSVTTPIGEPLLPPVLRPVLPPATIGILGGGQLGRMLAQAARAMGYRIAVLDPDIDCPSASVADELVIGAYDDIGAALRLAGRSAVVTYELEHIAAAVVEAIEPLVPVRPGWMPLVVTHDRIAERRYVEGAGIAVASWREVRTTDELRAATEALGLPIRLKAASGGYDGRGQIRVAAAD